MVTLLRHGGPKNNLIYFNAIQIFVNLFTRNYLPKPAINIIFMLIDQNCHQSSSKSFECLVTLITQFKRGCFLARHRFLVI